MTSPRPSTGAHARLIYAASESCADLLYATGLMAPDAFLWFSVGGRATVVVSALEIGRARKQVRSGTTVLAWHEARRDWGVKTERAPVEVLIAALARTVGVRDWEVPESFPLGLARRLEAQRVRLKPVAALFPERQSKSDAEIEHLREGVRLAETGLDCGLRILRASTVAADGSLHWQGAPLTAERLRGEIDAEIARHGGTASHTITAPGVQGADPHQTGSGPIRAGEPIVLDIFPRVDRTGYFGDLTRTVVKGKAPKVVRAAFAAVATAQKRAIAAVRAGVRADTVHKVALDTLTAAGFKTDPKASPPHGFFHGTGHGLGLEIHEAPRVSSRVRNRLTAGQVVTVEPGLYYPEWGGVRIEDVVVVRAGGCENLTTAPVLLEIA